MQKAGEMLNEVKEGIMNVYEIKTGMDRKKISHLMDAESWFNAKKAVELGFADGILHGKEDTEEGDKEKGRITTWTGRTRRGVLLMITGRTSGTPCAPRHRCRT